MRIAKAKNGNLVECRASTEPYETYTCFICSADVRARNLFKKEDGRKREYYFAHLKETDSHSVESYRHWIAKAIIEESNEILLPNGRLLYYTNVNLECTTLHHSVRPDVVLDKEIVIEICCSNKKTEKQITVFKQLNITSVEIYLDSKELILPLKKYDKRCCMTLIIGNTYLKNRRWQPLLRQTPKTHLDRWSLRFYFSSLPFSSLMIFLIVLKQKTIIGNSQTKVDTTLIDVIHNF